MGGKTYLFSITSFKMYRTFKRYNFSVAASLVLALTAKG